jgi:hypothetical protein
MRKTLCVCDLCKAETYDTKEVRDHWADVTVKLRNVEFAEKDLLLCPACLKKHGLLDENSSPKPPYQPNVAERLIEIIGEIAQEACSNA